MRFGSNRLQIAIIVFFCVLAITAVLAAVCCLLKFTKVYEFDFLRSEATYAKILLVGDLMFDRGIRYYAEKNGGNDFIFEKISDFLKNNDLVMANLEGPITANKSVSAGTSPGTENNYYFTFDPSLAQTLFEHNIKLVNMGNNHILNFGTEGLAETKKYLDDAGVGYFGSPDHPRGAAIGIKGVKIAFVSYNEFTDLDETANRESIFEEIGKIRNHADVVIVYCHWGVEYQKNSGEFQKELARSFIDAGADLVFGSHPHVVQESEEYKNKKIYYSLGNFVFDQYFSEDVRNGLGVVVKIDKVTKQASFEDINFYLAPQGQTILLEK